MAASDSLCRFTPQHAEPPLTNYGTPDIRDGTTTSHPVMDLAVNEYVDFSDVLPATYGDGGVTAYVHYAMSSAVGDNIKLEVSFELIGDQDQDLDSEGFAAAQNTGDVTVPGTSGLVDIVSVAFTHGAQMDSITPGDGFRVRVKRVTPVGASAAGDLEIRFVEIKETPV